MFSQKANNIKYTKFKTKMKLKIFLIVINHKFVSLIEIFSQFIMSIVLYLLRYGLPICRLKLISFDKANEEIRFLEKKFMTVLSYIIKSEKVMFKIILKEIMASKLERL